ncbi:MAG: ABC transporter ATP-binding protein, partial [Clostridia bacterium]
MYVLRRAVSEKLSRLPLKYFDGRTHGEILSRVTNDLDNVSNTLQQSITQIITSVATLIGVVAMMLSISPVLTLVIVITVPLYMLVTSVVVKKSQKYFRGQQAALGDLNGHVEEMYTAYREIKAYRHEAKSIEEFNEINERYYDEGWRAQFVSGIIMPLMNFISNVGYVFICVVGAVFVAGGHVSLGNVQAFMQYCRQFTQPIVQTANIANIIQSTIASAERVFEILDEEEEQPDAENAAAPKHTKGEVNFTHVSFGYDAGKTIISDLSFTAKPGQTIAIVGPTGAGKTTLVNLLMRFYEIGSGAIKIDGTDIRDIPRADLRGMFGMVLQDTWLFNGTVAENIAYGKEDA